MKRSFYVLLSVSFFCLCLPASAITPNQIDDFQGDGLSNWTQGVLGTANLDLITTGGPTGDDDQFMKLTPPDFGGRGGKVMVFNTNQWTGDYLNSGVTQIEMDLKNFSEHNLSMRLIIESLNGAYFAYSTEAVNLISLNNWKHGVFSLDSADLTIGNGPNIESILSNVTKLRIAHTEVPEPGIFIKPDLFAPIGIDNITAIPEPATLMLLGLGTLVLRRRRIF